MERKRHKCGSIFGTIQGLSLMGGNEPCVWYRSKVGVVVFMVAYRIVFLWQGRLSVIRVRGVIGGSSPF